VLTRWRQPAWASSRHSCSAGNPRARPGSQSHRPSLAIQVVMRGVGWGGMTRQPHPAISSGFRAACTIQRSNRGESCGSPRIWARWWIAFSGSGWPCFDSFAQLPTMPPPGTNSGAIPAIGQPVSKANPAATCVNRSGSLLRCWAPDPFTRQERTYPRVSPHPAGPHRLCELLKYAAAAHLNAARIKSRSAWAQSKRSSRKPRRFLGGLP
jgi:hypothetical protein